MFSGCSGMRGGKGVNGVRIVFNLRWVRDSEGIREMMDSENMVDLMFL